MSKHVKRTALLLFLVMTGVGGFAAYEFQRNMAPTIRGTIATPLFTIGEIEGYGQALASGRRVIKFGPMFFGLYPGGLAFKSKEEAQDYLEKQGWNPQNWSAYQTSGDYSLDATRGYTNKSLLITPEAS